MTNENMAAVGKKETIFFLSAAAIALLRAGSLHFYSLGKFSISPKSSLLFIFLRWITYTGLFFFLFKAFDRFLHREAGGKNILFSAGGEKVRGYWKDYLFLGAGWLPALLIKYPAALCWDTWLMIAEYRGNTVTKAQSVYLTYMLGKLVEVFEKQGRANVGLFTFSVMNYLLCVAGFGYALNVLRRMRVSGPVRAVVFFLVLLNPYILGYVGVIIKDLPYAVSVMAVTAALIDIDFDCEGFLRNPFRILLLVFMSVMAILTRGNGLYIVIVLTAAGAVKALVEKRGIRPVLILAAGCAIGILVSSILTASLEAGESSKKEILSLPFQQTARYVKYHADEVTEEEREAINGVLDYGSLGQKYDPCISDPI